MPFHTKGTINKNNENPVIYGFPINCFCIAVCQCMKALGLQPELVTVSYGIRSEIILLTGGEHYLVPVMQYKNKVISDSLDIAHYIDNQFDNKLFPRETIGLQTIILPYLNEDCHHAVEMLTDVPLIDSITDLVDKVMVIRHKERKFGKKCIERWRNDIPNLYNTLVKLTLPFEQMLEYRPFLLGSIPVYLDFLLYGIFGNLLYNNYYQFPEELPKVQQWYEKISTYKY